MTEAHRPLTFHLYVGSPPWTDWHAIWGIEWRPRRNHPCQILCKSVKGFLAGSTPNSVIFYTYSNDPYNNSALPCRLWYLKNPIKSMWPRTKMIFEHHILSWYQWNLLFQFRPNPYFPASRARAIECYMYVAHITFRHLLNVDLTLAEIFQEDHQRQHECLLVSPANQAWSSTYGSTALY